MATTLPSRYVSITGEDVVDRMLHYAVKSGAVPFRIRGNEVDVISMRAAVVYLKFDGIGDKMANNLGIDRPHFTLDEHKSSERRAVATPAGILASSVSGDVAKAFFADVDGNGTLHVIALAGARILKAPIIIASKYGFISYINLRIMGFAEPIDWSKRIEDVKKFETWFPLYGVYYFPRGEEERAARMVLDADLADMLVRVSKLASRRLTKSLLT